MRLKKYTQGVTFFITPDMLEVLKKISDEKQVSVSEVLREVLNQYISQWSHPSGDHGTAVVG
jgi:hypothetical protein